MNKEESKTITIDQEKKIKRLSTIIMIIIIIIIIIVTADIILVAKFNKGPFLAIPLKTYNDGGTKEYYGLGYKVIKYNQKIGRKDMVIGSWFLKYNTTPKDFTLSSLAYSIINDNTDYKGSFLRITGTISKIDKKNKTLTLIFKDEEKGKYDLTIKAHLLSDINKFNLNAPVSLLGTVSSYEKKDKTLTLENTFAE